MTGVDSRTDINDLVALSSLFPFVEWGLLYSPKRAGNPGRYMSFDDIMNVMGVLGLMPNRINISIHFCGKSVINLINGHSNENELALLSRVRKMNGRIQLNFNASKDEDFSIDALNSFIESNKDIEIITQKHQGNALIENSVSKLKNHAVLFDSSGGLGIANRNWNEEVKNIKHGFAGGIGSENIRESLLELSGMGKNHANPFIWIDMEGQLRVKDKNDVDWFSTLKAEACLIQVKQWLSELEAPEKKILAVA